MKNEQNNTVKAEFKNGQVTVKGKFKNGQVTVKAEFENGERDGKIYESTCESGNIYSFFIEIGPNEILEVQNDGDKWSVFVLEGYQFEDTIDIDYDITDDLKLISVLIEFNV